jgi:hypothetical protein
MNLYYTVNKNQEAYIYWNKYRNMVFENRVLRIMEVAGGWRKPYLYNKGLHNL